MYNVYQIHLVYIVGKLLIRFCDTLLIKIEHEFGVRSRRNYGHSSFFFFCGSEYNYMEIVDERIFFCLLFLSFFKKELLLFVPQNGHDAVLHMTVLIANVMKMKVSCRCRAGWLVMSFEYQLG